MLRKLSLVALLLGAGVQAHELRRPDEQAIATAFDVVEAGEEVEFTAARDDPEECPEGEDMIPGIGCRGNPEGDRPICDDGRPARRACYRENTSWWQCEEDCYLGPPESEQGQENRRRPPPDDTTSSDYSVYTAAKDDECPEGEDMIPGIGCRGDPEGPKPRCGNGQTAHRACYRENMSWWQCENDCYLGPPRSKQGRINRREKRREEREQPPVDDKAIDADENDRTCKHYWLTITCRGDDTSSTETSETDMTSSQEVRDANVCDECLQGDGTHCSWNWKAEGCTNGGGGGNNRNTRRPTNRPTPRPNNGGNNKSSIQCTKPNPKRIQKEGQQAVCDSLETSPPRDVMYKCEDGSRLCCTESDMRKVTFSNKDWGECRMKGGSEEIVSEA